ncbi:uncharacterized protein LOC107781395 [Nicotiana tabacum]|uniref:Uncharacterized protein LOC107781395 n=1 Tax=Nicotiana tabacum TaxID=4097 RepID=A0A1S3YZQ0_TOBAC|nr:uncharacterized protein LOC104101704 [Nicotiana tomentosiformis]XP_016457575.1 PREDICTED: uncharacterized protein LOC107781395 [Nicotiana tabacum]
MATKSDMKGFYKQKKKGGGIAKPSNSKSSFTKKSTTPKNAAAIGSDVTQPPALISHGSLDLQDDYDQNEEVLRQFDMNMTYGPCLGMSRLDRWERAKRLGLNPPTDVERLLRSSKVRHESLWDGRV